MKLPALVHIVSACSFITTAMARNETLTVVAANSSSLVLVNATSQAMSLVNQSLQPNIENMDEEKRLGGEEGFVGKCRAHNAKACKTCKLACLSWLLLWPVCMVAVCHQGGNGPCCVWKRPPFQAVVSQDV
ncbi:hypothetical protein ANO14919_106540 [Xylariales sp. No.14919]|nr:hypothetical protein ANO14919_106540 [Xylariales sp. No.14919]